MKTKVIKIGNSRGIRIPKTIIEQMNLDEEVELEVADDKIVIKSVSKSRKNWDASFIKMAENNDDVLLDSELLNSHSSWDSEEWAW